MHCWKTILSSASWSCRRAKIRIRLFAATDKEQFEKRVANARDFFDYWIEREIANIDLASMGAKIQAARNLAATVSRVHDPVLRGEVVNKASARLGVVPADFESLLAKRARVAGGSVNSSATETRAAASPPHDIVMLCLLALRNAEARNFLRAQKWREILEQVPDTDILIRILESELEPDDTASLNAFMATLSPEEERLISSWLMQKMPASHRNSGREVVAGDLPECRASSFGDGKKPDQSPGVERW